MRTSPLFIEEVVYPENLGNYRNLFTIIAPSFKGDTGLSFFAIPFSYYVAQITKRGGPRLYILDVSIPYGRLNGYPQEGLETERKTKIEKLEKCLDLFGCDNYSMIYLEDELNPTRKEEIANLEEIKARVKANIDVDEDALEASRKVSYESKSGLPLTDKVLAERFREYERLRKIEYSLITKKYNAVTIKQSNPAEDEPFDVSIYEGKIPRIYLRRPKGSRIFRPKDELRLDDSQESFLSKLSDRENLEMAAISTKAYEGMNLYELENWIKTASEIELKEAAKKAWDLVVKVNS